MNVMVVGKTKYGKSYWVQQALKKLDNGKQKFIIFDPVYNKWDVRNKRVFYEKEAFEACCRINNNAIVVIDEAAEYFKYGTERSWIFSLGRHLKYSTFLIAQWPAAIPLNIRNNCTAVVSFALTPKYSKILADDVNPIFKKCSSFGPYEHISYEYGKKPIYCRKI